MSKSRGVGENRNIAERWRRVDRESKRKKESDLEIVAALKHIVLSTKKMKRLEKS